MARRAVDAVKRIPRPLRSFCLVVGGWLALFLAVNLVVVLIGVAARWAGKDPRVHDDIGPTSGTCGWWATGCWSAVRHLRSSTASLPSAT